MNISGHNNSGGVFKTLAIGCATVILVGIILFGIIAYFGYKTLKKRVVTNPDEVETQAREIMDYRFPGGSSGILAMNIGFKLSVVRSRKNPPVVLVLAAFPPGWSGDSRKTVEQSLREAFSNQKDFIVSRMVTKTGNICGQRIAIAEKEGWQVYKDGRRVSASSIQTSLRQNKRLIFVQVTGTGENHGARAASVFATLRCPAPVATSRTQTHDPGPRSQVVVSRKYVYYPIAGSSVQELRDQMNRVGPNEYGRRYWGKTDTPMNLYYQFTIVNGRCTYSQARVNLQINVTLPRWNAPPDAPTDLVNRWDRFMAALKNHEEGHGQIAIRCAHGVLDMLQTIPSYPTCPQFQEVADGSYKRFVDQCHDQEVDYDKITRHGKSQGAIF